MSAPEAVAQRPLSDLFRDGVEGIPVSRTRDIYSELEERELSAQEEAIVSERVAFQKNLWAVYEKRELLRKCEAIGAVLSELTREDAGILAANFAREEDAIAAATAHPEGPAGLISELQPAKSCTVDGLPASNEGDNSSSGAEETLPEVPACSSKRRRSARRLQPVAILPDSQSNIKDPCSAGRSRDKSVETSPHDQSTEDVAEVISKAEVAAIPGADLGSVASSGRPRRKAAEGVAHLMKRLRDTPVDTASATERKRPVPLIRRKPARKPSGTGDNAVPPLATTDEPVTPSQNRHTSSARPSKKPRLGRVKRCSMKPVKLLAVGKLRVQAGWCNHGCIFPDGFRSSTSFRSSVDPGLSCDHICSIVGKGGKFWPLPTYTILADDSAELIVAKSATGAWTAIQHRINAAINARRKAGEKLPPPPGTAIPGPEFFGLTHPDILAHIEKLDPDRRCEAYWQGKQERTAYISAHGDAPVKRDCSVPSNPRQPRAPRPQLYDSDETSEEEDEAEIVYDDSDAASDFEQPSSRWSAVDRARRRHLRAGFPEGEGQETPVLAGALDPVTLQRMHQPAMSPNGHVMGLATWSAVLASTGHCPFTQQPIRRDQLTILTPSNIERYRSRLVIDTGAS